MTVAHATSAVMERLKAETLEAHKAAEGHPLQRAHAMGKLPQEQYVRNLGQLFHVHRALEAALRETAAKLPAIRTIVKEYQYQEPYLREDLAHFGVKPESVAALPATARIVARIGELGKVDPLALLGMHYVLEGSNNGSKFLCRVVQRQYGLAPGPGTRYMDPYGDRQREFWEQFKADMNAAGFNEEQATALVGAAGEMFDAIGAIGTDVLNAGA